MPATQSGITGGVAAESATPSAAAPPPPSENDIKAADSHRDREERPPRVEPPAPPPEPNFQQQQQQRQNSNSAGPKPHEQPVTQQQQQPPQPQTQEQSDKRLKAQQQLKVPDARKSSTVSFKDVCELFEIDLEANRRPAKPPAVFSLRYYIMILALISPFVVTYSKTIINFAIIDMIEPDYLNHHKGGQHTSTTTSTTTQAPLSPGLSSSSSSTQSSELYEYIYGPQVRPAGLNGTGAEAAAAASARHDDEELIIKPLDSYFDLDNSCPVDEATRARLDNDLKIDQIRAHDNKGEKFPWDTVKQGLLKAAYSIGHMLLQVMGGRLSEIYGSHMIMGLSSALIGFSCLAAPFLASTHFYLLFADLFFLGILGSFMTPALITMFSNWLTPSEKSVMLSFYLVSSRLGYALSSLLCGLLIQAQLSWRYLFYSAGWISFVFSILSFICSRSRPHEHPFIGQAELDYLASKNTLVREALARAKAQRDQAEAKQMDNLGAANDKRNSNASDKSSQQTTRNAATNSSKTEPQQQQKQQHKPQAAPWMAIMTNGPVWAFIVTKFCVKLAGDTVQIELPTYLKRVMHLAPKHNGVVNASNYVIFCVSCLVVGALAKTANKRRPFGWSKTTVRKMFQFTASFGVGLSLLGIALCACQETATLILLMLMFFFTTFGTGGEAQIPLDISERYAGTIHAIGSSLAISGAIEPVIVGYFLKDYPADRDRWAGVWLGASAIAFVGGLVFVLIGDATIQPFDKVGVVEEPEVAKETRKTSRDQKLKGHVNETFQNDNGDGSPASDSNQARKVQENGAPFKESQQI